MKDSGKRMMLRGEIRKGAGERQKPGLDILQSNTLLPGVSSREVRRLITEITPESRQSSILIRITSTLFVLQVLYFLTIEVICWEEKNNTTRLTHFTTTPEFPKTTWEAILIINYSRPPNIDTSMPRMDPRDCEREL